MITTQELTEWLHQESRLCKHIAEQPYIADDDEKKAWWTSKADYLRESSERLSVFEDIIRHAWIHSGYRECGRKEMTTEQKAAFDAVVANAKAENEELIEQHDSYEFRDYHLLRASSDHYTEAKTWVVYFQGKAIETFMRPPRQPKKHIDLAKAIEAALVFDSDRQDGKFGDIASDES